MNYLVCKQIKIIKGATKAMANDLHTLLYGVFQSHVRLSSSAFSKLDLSSAQPKILYYLKEHGGARQKDIAEGCNIDPATVTSVIKGMEKNDLIIRRTDEQDRRVTRTYLTEKGQDLIAAISNGFENIERLAFSGFNQKEAQDFKSFLQRMGENLHLAEHNQSLN